ncbi:MAG: DUF2147 domain-containing protein [Micavibrio aeruginosavorus]|uniref:DUF2147 domain-containing protein n=1 Tax=Micavibrio aeruginosavorus TaxID=349221 RepID=A0A7T5R240_9BACT|nr:MAG: DUF2147 domain-containing protein [Micavibrio aeruginosavorus]
MKYLSLFVFGLICAVALPAQARNTGPTGLWLTENQRSVIAIEKCGEGLCGRVHWIIEGGMQFDEHNEDPAQTRQPMCGLKILWGFKQQDAANWIDGKIYKADEGDLYNATLQMLPKGNMLVRGYVGMPLFGKSQTWTPVDAASYPRCKPAKP